MNAIACRTSLAAAVFAATLVLAACGNPDASELVASAKEYLAKQDVKSAVIQLRNARQQAPNDAEIRFMLGKAYLLSADPQGAEIELRKARELGYSADQVLPLIAQALVARREFRAVTSEFADPKISDPKARAELFTTVAIAALAQGDIATTRKMIDNALAENPKLPRAHVAQGSLLLRGGDVAGAERAAETALTLAPNDLEAGLMKANLLEAQGKRAEAVALLERMVASHPSASLPRYRLAWLHLGNKDTAKAEPIVQALQKEAPKEFRTVQLAARLEILKGNPAKARELTQQLLAEHARLQSEPPEHVPTLYLSALADFQLKNYARVEESLQKVIARVPDDVDARRLLAYTYLQTGRPTQALQVAQAALARRPEEPSLLRLAAESRLLTGNVAEATKLYERASALDRDPQAIGRLRLAQIRVATGDAARGFAELEQLSADDPKQISADLHLYSLHLRRREYDKALAAVASIEKKQPGSALAAELRGNVNLARRNVREARKHLARALEIEPTRLTAARTLALIDLQEGKVADARARYEAIAKAQPRNENPLVALAELLALSGAPATEVKGVLERAIAADPAAPGPRLALIAHHHRISDARGAVEAARAGASALPNEPRMLDALGTAQMAAGEAAQARETFSRLAQLVPQNPMPWVRVSEAYIAQKNYSGAIEAQRRALTIQPDNPTALLALATTHLLSGRPEDALAEARKVQRERPKQGFGFALEAEILAAQKKYAEALGPMREAFSREPSTSRASRQYALLTLAGRTSEAKTFGDRWLKEHPKDAAFLSLVGQQRHGANDVPGAIAAYRAALEIDPDNVIVLNNLAWLLNEQRRPEARELAEHAYQLAPLNPNVVDTLGHVVLTQGDTARAISLMRQATNLAPRDARLRVNLARALARTGDKAAARKELERVVATDTRARAKAEAQQLLREL